MALKIKLKNSVVKDKAPLPADLDIGEVAINAHQDSPGAYIKDATGAIRKIAGVGSVSTPDATDAVKGVVELATPAEATAGTDTTRAVTPAGLKAAQAAAAGSSTAPAAPTTGQVWVDSSTSPSTIKVWNGTAWIPQAGSTVTSATAPTTPTTGQIWIDTSASPNVTKIWDGTAWVTATPGGAAAAAIANDAKYATKAELAKEDLWDRTGTTLSPTNAGDLISSTDGSRTALLGTDGAAPYLGTGGSPYPFLFKVGDGTVDVERARLTETGNFLVGGTPAAPNLQLKADGGIVANTNGLFYDAATKRLAIGVTGPDNALHLRSAVDKNLVFSGEKIYTLNDAKTLHTPLTFTGQSLVFETQNGATPPSEKARLTADGKLLVGTSSSVSGSISQYARVQILGNSSSSTGCFNIGLNVAASGLGSGTDVGYLVFCDNSSGQYAHIKCITDGVSSSSSDTPGALVFSTTPDSGSSPVERLRITNTGTVSVGNPSAPGSAGAKISINTSDAADTPYLEGAYPGTFSYVAFYTTGTSASNPSASSTAMKIWKSSSTSRSISAAGTINASGADYAEYMTKSGDFIVAKGDICGINLDGKLTNVFADAIGFVVKSTDPSYVGGDTWGTENAVGTKPSADEPELLAQWQADFETARQKVDRIAFAGQVPINVTGATPGQYIVPVEDNGGISGIAKDEADLTLAEYMRAVGKVIAIEDDGRARIIVKVA